MRKSTVILVLALILVFPHQANADEIFYQFNKDLQRVWLNRLPDMALDKKEGAQAACRLGPDYRLGYGDTVALTLWGKMEGSYEVTLNRDGDMVIPPLGKIRIMGLTLNQAREVVRREIDQKFTNVEFELGVKDVRDIVVEVLGNVTEPGAYQVSPCASVLDALAKAGGPNTSGTLADIRLRRAGQVIDSFNFYDYILKGRESEAQYLKHDDVIFVPAIQNIYAVRGDVRYPGIYDLPGEPMLSQALGMAGGMRPVNLKRKISVIRVNADTLQTEVGKEIILSSADRVTPEEDFRIRNFDTIMIGTDSDFSPYQKDLFNEVQVTGEVQAPGRYRIDQGEKLSTLLKKIEISPGTAFLKGAVFVRPSLKSKEKSVTDRLIAAQKQLILEEEARLAGLLLSDEERQRQQKAFQARREALATLASRIPDGRIIIDLESIMAGEKDILLEKGDSLFIPAIPDWVLVTGAVYHPQSILFEPGKSPEYYLAEVGGIKDNGDAKGLYVIKADGRTESQKTGFSKTDKGDVIIVPQKYK